MIIIKLPCPSKWGKFDNGLLFLPAAYGTGIPQNYPLLLFFNGSGEGGTDPALLYNSQNAGGPTYFINNNTFPDLGMIVCGCQYPEAWANSASDIDVIISWFIQNYKIDTNRIYLTGISAGGQGIVDYVSHNGITPSYKIAAMVPMSAAIVQGNAKGQGIVAAADGVKAWGFGDPLGDVHGKSTQLFIEGTGGKFTSYTGGHSGWGQFYNPTYKENGLSIYEWMLQQSLVGTVTLPPVIPPVTKKLISTIHLYDDGTYDKI